MSFLHSSHTMQQHSILPLPPTVEGLTTQQIQQLGIKAALSMLHDHEAVIHLNPLVTAVSELSSTDPHAVDYAALSQVFETVDTTAADAIAQPWRQYEIHDDLPLPFGYKRELIYYSAIRGLPGGFESFTNPGSGVTLYGAWKVGLERVRANGDMYELPPHAQQHGSTEATGNDDLGGKWETVIHVEEVGEVHANWFLAQYIKLTYPSSHKVMHARLREEWIERMKKALQDERQEDQS